MAATATRTATATSDKATGRRKRAWLKFDPKRKCRHCRHPKVTRPRGLCWRCYAEPGVRDQYQSTSKFAARPDVRDSYSTRPLPATPTTAQPGSQAKVQVLRERAARGEALHHPLDNAEPIPAKRPVGNCGPRPGQKPPTRKQRK